HQGERLTIDRVFGRQVFNLDRGAEAEVGRLIELISVVRTGRVNSGGTALHFLAPAVDHHLRAVIEGLSIAGEATASVPQFHLHLVGVSDWKDRESGAFPQEQRRGKGVDLPRDRGEDEDNDGRMGQQRTSVGPSEAIGEHMYCAVFFDALDPVTSTPERLLKLVRIERPGYFNTIGCHLEVSVGDALSRFRFRAPDARDAADNVHSARYGRQDEENREPARVKNIEQPSGAQRIGQEAKPPFLLVEPFALGERAGAYCQRLLR